VELYLPDTPADSATIDFIGEPAVVDAAQKELAAYLAALAGATRDVQVDHSIHSILNAKAGQQ